MCRVLADISQFFEADLAIDASLSAACRFVDPAFEYKMTNYLLGKVTLISN